MTSIKRISDLERRYVSEVLDSEFRSSSGAQFMRRLEETFASRIGATYAIAMVNGTATLHATLEALGIGDGDEVIVPPLTMSATTFAVLQAGAVPVFADVDPQTFQIDPVSIREHVTDRTRAILTVALYGLSPDMDEIKSIADDYNLAIIEDNAECFLGKYKGRMVGTLGDAASFSFQSSKHLTAGEGGIVVTNNEELANSIRRVSSLGYAGLGALKGKITKADIQSPEYDRHVQLGWNYRMPELCSAVALAQTERIDELVKVRMQASEVFLEVLKNYDWLTPQLCPPDYVNSYWTTAACNHSEKVKWTDLYHEFVSRGGDGFYAAWKLSYMEPFFQLRRFLGREKRITADQWKNYSIGSCPVAEYLQPRLLQFKTDYWDISDAYRQAEILNEALSSCDKNM